MFPKAGFPLTAEQLSEAMADRADSTVVELDGELVAFANFHKWEDGGFCSIGNVVVSGRQRRQGVGTFLIGTMEEIARREHRARELRVSCFHTNAAGLLLYARMGFSPCAIEERTAKDGSPVALIHMSRAIAMP